MILAFSIPSAVAKNKTPDPIMHAWLTPACPVNSIEESRSALVSGLLSWGVDFLLDSMGRAISDAAKADREGKATKVVVPSYLYLQDAPHTLTIQNSTKDATTTQPVARRTSPMGCVVIAMATNPPSHWCQSTPDLKEACDEDGMLYGINHFPRGQDTDPRSFSTPLVVRWPDADSTDAPRFYAEIALLPATDRTGVLPELRTLYYPKGLHGGKFDRSTPRDIILSANASLPKGDAALGSILVRLKGVTPNGNVQKSLSTDLATWTPLISFPEKLTLPETSGGAVAVNLSAEVREVGKPNKFLQAFATAFEKYKGDIASELKSHTPSAQDEAGKAEEAQIAAAVNKYEEGVSKAHTATVAFVTSCSSPATPAKQASVAAALNEARKHQTNVVKLAEAAGISAENRATFVPDVRDVTASGDKILESCKVIGS